MIIAQAHADQMAVGGSGYFIGHGFGCDNVVAYETVLASGVILNVTASSHSDLFRALKGGSSNFGIVTSFEIRTVPLSDRTYGEGTSIITQNPLSSNN